MTKSELMENYTMEQLAEMVVKLQDKKKCENKSFKIPSARRYDDELEKFLKENPLQSSIDKICKDIIEQENNAMAMEFTKSICKLLEENKVKVHCTYIEFEKKTTENSITEKYGVMFDGMDFSEHDKEFTDEIEKLKSQLNCKQAEIGELKSENAELHCEMQAMNVFGEGMPTQPIEVASMLINAVGEYEHNSIAKAFCGTDKGAYNLFDTSELRQIAEHLLVYCNAN